MALPQPPTLGRARTDTAPLDFSQLLTAEHPVAVASELALDLMRGDGRAELGVRSWMVPEVLSVLEGVVTRYGTVTGDTAWSYRSCVLECAGGWSLVRVELLDDLPGEERG